MQRIEARIVFVLLMFVICGLLSVRAESNKQDNLLLTWPRDISQFELSLSSGVPLFNALFLSILWEYEHKSYIVEN